jgi:predicted TIM-barrel fold metal-dependent hydrolase
VTIDAATYLGPWPFRLVEGTLPGLRRMMRAERIRQALLSPFEGLFHQDPGPANERLLRRISGKAGLYAGPVVNPLISDWRHHMAHLCEQRQVCAVRFAPGFHGYAVDAARDLVAEAARRGLATIVQIRIQDERHHRAPPQRAEEAPLGDIVALAAAVPRARVVAAGAYLAEALRQADHIRQLRNLWLDISHIDGLACLREARDAVGARHLLFATSWPFFYARSATLKVDEAELPQRDVEAIRVRNAKTAFRLR